MRIYRSPTFEVPEFYEVLGRRWVNHVLSVQAYGAFEVVTHPLSEVCPHCADQVGEPG